MRTAFARNGAGFGGPPGGANGGASANGQTSGQNGQGGPPWARSGNEGDRNEWRKRIIDRTSPEQLARWTEYRNAVDKRRDELGLGNPWRG